MRFPNVVAAVDGTVLAFWGGVTVNEANGEIFAFVGKGHPPTTETVYRSQDHGKIWSAVKVEIKPDSKGGRNKGTIWASFDGAKTWPLKRLVTQGAFAYSSLDAGRPGTKSEGWIYLLSEGSGAQMARFNLSWLLQGEKTGDGEVPKWVSETAR